MPKYEVFVSRTITQSAVITIDAENVEDAHDTAAQCAIDSELPDGSEIAFEWGTNDIWDDIDTEIQKVNGVDIADMDEEDGE